MRNPLIVSNKHLFHPHQYMSYNSVKINVTPLILIILNIKTVIKPFKTVSRANVMNYIAEWNKLLNVFIFYFFTSFSLDSEYNYPK